MMLSSIEFDELCALKPSYCSPTDSVNLINDNAAIRQNIQKAYDECISNTIKPSATEQRFKNNYHLINTDLETNPMFVIGHKTLSDHMKIEVLYVFPEYRRKGVCRLLLKWMQDFVDRPVLITVDADKAATLSPFFESLGFRAIDSSDKQFIDYSWSSSEYKADKESGLLIKYVETAKA